MHIIVCMYLKMGRFPELQLPILLKCMMQNILSPLSKKNGTFIVSDPSTCLSHVLDCKKCLLCIMIMAWWLFFSIYEKFQNTYVRKQRVIVKRMPLHSGHYSLNFHEQGYFTKVYFFQFHTHAFCLFLLAFIRWTLLSKMPPKKKT